MHASHGGLCCATVARVGSHAVAAALRPTCPQVKQFLAFRLTELSADCQQLSGELNKAQASSQAPGRRAALSRLCGMERACSR